MKKILIALILTISTGCVYHNTCGEGQVTAIFVEGSARECIRYGGDAELCDEVEAHYSMSAAFSKIFLTLFGWIPGVD